MSDSTKVIEVVKDRYATIARTAHAMIQPARAGLIVAGRPPVPASEWICLASNLGTSASQSSRPMAPWIA